ncbi:UNVERIFIED_CONTAM: hypothetical protein Sradi_3017200 [Sesamum radiatum]|uniref:DUF4218 domain-containing protein n=1 Tax=Sesamum radiatum TaxID=300843 RepID=A0AAW2S1G1_SESRA
MLSGWGTKGAYACPNCGKDTRSKWLDNGHKYCYTCHRRFLPRGHKLRRDKVSFDGTIEMEIKKASTTVTNIISELDSVATEYKKEDLRKRRRAEYEKESEEHIWKKKSIFFELPYWSDNLIRHNLDVMHIEKNKRNIRLPLHPVEKGSGKYYLPPAPFTLGKRDKETFCKVLKSVKAPDGYASNISRHTNVKEQTIGGLKSHDNHVLIQQLLPLAVRRSLPKNVVDTLIELEKIFPPSFFDIMEHLPVHLVDEALKGGPIQFRWMYPIERYLLTLKRYVRNRAYPEGSIARGYLMDECMNFCSRYLSDVETKENRTPRNYDCDETMGRVVGKGERFFIDSCTLLQAHRYILSNTDEVEPFRNMHIAEIVRERPRPRPWEIDRIHSQTFHEWFKSYVSSLQKTSNAQLSEEIKRLAEGPMRHGRRYKACIVRGFRFRTKSNDESKATQNSGIVLKADTKSYSNKVWYVRDVYSRFEAELYSNQRLDDRLPTADDDVGWTRQGVHGVIVDENDDNGIGDDDNDF